MKKRTGKDKAAKQPHSELKIAKRIAELKNGSADEALRKAIEIAEEVSKNRKSRENP